MTNPGTKTWETWKTWGKLEKHISTALNFLLEEFVSISFIQFMQSSVILFFEDILDKIMLRYPRYWLSCRCLFTKQSLFISKVNSSPAYNGSTSNPDTFLGTEKRITTVHMQADQLWSPTRTKVHRSLNQTFWMTKYVDSKFAWTSVSNGFKLSKCG